MTGSDTRSTAVDPNIASVSSVEGSIGMRAVSAFPRARKLAARLVAIRVLPTPPLVLKTEITRAGWSITFAPFSLDGIMRCYQFVKRP
ncbi:MAG: hypothetical protein HYY90_02500 [Candidatus Omnitrophica bacterium]|nr:hypothetical protein [Candidatus Omnitrophota bacterium]